MFLPEELQAAIEAGAEHGEEGDDHLVAHLTHIAKTQPAAFCGLLGKVLPLTLAVIPVRPS